LKIASVAAPRISQTVSLTRSTRRSLLGESYVATYRMPCWSTARLMGRLSNPVMLVISVTVPVPCVTLKTRLPNGPLFWCTATNTSPVALVTRSGTQFPASEDSSVGPKT
jgi:hypothetical protein